MKDPVYTSLSKGKRILVRTLVLLHLTKNSRHDEDTNFSQNEGHGRSNKTFLAKFFLS